MCEREREAHTRWVPSDALTMGSKMRRRTRDGSHQVWSKVLKSPVRNQTLLFSDVGTEGHELRQAAFEAASRRFFGRVLFMIIPSNQVRMTPLAWERITMARRHDLPL